jgi:hypothetical protein
MSVAFSAREGKILPWRFWKEEESKEEQDRWDHLQTPWDTECCWITEVLVAANIAGAKADVVHDQDAPGDGPLLSTNDTTTFAGRLLKSVQI